MRSPTKEKHITLLIHDNQTGVISHTTNIQGETRKGITSPTLGQWHVSPLYLHPFMEEILNHRAHERTMPKEQGFNKKGPNSILSQ